MKTTEDGVVHEDGNIKVLFSKDVTQAFLDKRTPTILPQTRNAIRELDDLKALLRSKGVI